MLKIHLEAKKRCYNHTHRLGERVCSRCKLSLCDECIGSYEGAEVCTACQRELEAAKALIPTFGERVRGSALSLVRGIIILAVLVGIGAAVFLFLRPRLDKPLTPEEWARLRYAASGSFETPDGIHVTSPILDGSVVRVTSEAPGYEAKNLINEFWMAGWPGWLSADAELPQEIVVRPRDATVVEKVLLANHPEEPEASWVKDFEVLVSNERPDAGWVSVGRWRLEPTAEPQRFTFEKRPARYIMLRILSRYGDSPYTSLAEFDVFLVPARLGGAPAETPTPRPAR
ncbi:MAG: hypothetical protein HYY04_09425 [Chloroflexi bacterium]|nr:hypothetical protein [Chloroflexota bacterium]